MSGKITTHVLDISTGKAAAGMGLELWQLSEETGERRLLQAASTNADGRLDAPMLAGENMQPGVYELVFNAGSFLSRDNDAARESSIEFIFQQIPIRFRVKDAQAHYHIPLLVAPGGYSTYRGT
ncbi:hydroxyisourate hydrolase [Paenibacillus sp. Leaf72]|uniref:hydroxyisourate hydrolase n=1 Tax=Paenibacillus sp. Leaf72 TaxID=1736234 RepID=UPI0006FCA3AB|nr:hydroxyisourate hydrolase [Paenibacillus sp. Leaf72]KQO04290.1 5-hydroxyisourate hydrolase [Paenibacillus sp. Leaf72]